MTSKERMQMVMEHEEPDRVPYMATFVPELEFALKKRCREQLQGIDADVEIKYQGMTDLDILFDHDMLLLTYGISTGYYRDTESDTYMDEWGITWRKISYQTVNGPGCYTEIVDFPLADDSRIDSYQPPDPENEDMGYAETVIARFGKEKYICGIIDCSVFEALKYLRGITQSLAKEVGPKGITVNAFCPGVINTDLWKYLDREMGKLEGLEPTQLIKKVTKLIPLGRVGQPSDVAGLVSFLASKDADYITGQAIFVGGGIIML